MLIFRGLSYIELTLIILFSIFGLSCTANKKSNETEDISIAKMDSLQKKNIYEKIEYFVNEYDVKEDERLRLENSSYNYAIDDSLCFYMAKLDKTELVGDDYFRFLMGKLLEKKYLGVRNYGKFDPDFFAVYNMSIVTYARESNRLALDIILNGKVGEFTCIDSVVLVLDKLPQMQTDANHQKCIDLVRNNKTGGCKW